MCRQDCQNTPPQLGKQLNAYVSHAAFKGYVERVMQIMKLALTVLVLFWFGLGFLFVCLFFVFVCLFFFCLFFCLFVCFFLGGGFWAFPGS